MSNEQTDQPRPRRGCAGIFFFFMLLMAVVWGSALGFALSVLDDSKETITALEDFRPKIGSKVYSWDGELLGEFSIEERQLLPLNQIPLHVQKAFIATEDHPFYSHKGVRPDAIVRAAVHTLQTGNRQGGSTITQQVVRNVDDLTVGREVTMDRKIREAIVALQVERQFTKDEILELYLNEIFLGISAYGVEAAAWQYFDKSCQDVTLSEAAMMAGLTRSPNNNQPFGNFNNARDRRDIVLHQMLNQRFITEEEYEAAIAEDLSNSIVTPEERAERRARDGRRQSRMNRAPYFVEEVRKFIYEQYQKEEVLEGGLDIYTTVDLRLQRAAEQALIQALEEFDRPRLEAYRRRGEEDKFMPVSGALVCIDNRDEYKGFVRALVGGRDFETQKFNNATQALRQPGSSIKPFIWAAAVEQLGYTPATQVLDAPYVRRAPGGQVWAPGNFDRTYSGWVPLGRALERSINTVSVRLTEKVSPPVVRSYLQRCGYSRPINPATGLTIALGTPEITVLDQTVAFSTFANQGTRHDPVFVTSIFNRDGLIAYDYRDFQRTEEAMAAEVANVVTSMLEGAATRGTGATATRPLGDRPRAGKTGTTNDFRDAWFAGYTPNFTTVVWLGYTDNRPLGSGNNYTGGRQAAPIWTEFMLVAEEGLPLREFPKPAVSSAPSTPAPARQPPEAPVQTQYTASPDPQPAPALDPQVFEIPDVSEMELIEPLW